MLDKYQEPKILNYITTARTNSILDQLSHLRTQGIYKGGGVSDAAAKQVCFETTPSIPSVSMYIFHFVKFSYLFHHYFSYPINFATLYRLDTNFVNLLSKPSAYYYCNVAFCIDKIVITISIIFVPIINECSNFLFSVSSNVRVKLKENVHVRSALISFVIYFLKAFNFVTGRTHSSGRQLKTELTKHDWFINFMSRIGRRFAISNVYPLDSYLFTW